MKLPEMCRDSGGVDKTLVAQWKFNLNYEAYFTIEQQ